MRLVSIVSALFFYISASHAATISVEIFGPNKAVVAVEGPLYAEDGKQFSAKVDELSNAIVSFRSDGGSIVAGIQIGEKIRLKGFATVVSTGQRCASACALAWLGGAPRLVEFGSTLEELV